MTVQDECGVVVGEDYPYPVVDFEARRERFWTRYERARPAAAAALARPEIAKRASFSGGYAAARSIAQEYADDADAGTQVSLGAVTNGDGDVPADDGRPDPERPTTGGAPDDGTRSGPDESPLPTGVGERAGAPSPDDRAAMPEDDADGRASAFEDADDTDDSQTTIETFD